MDTFANKHLQARIEALKVLIVDDDHYMRKVVRAMLTAIGVKTIMEACDGVSGLDSIRTYSPNLVVVDWEMPMINGGEFVRLVRSPGEFPVPDVPIIMLTGHGERWRVLEAVRRGAHEYLLKPVSIKALHDRIVSIISNPRPSVKLGDYYGPEPRKLTFVDEGTKTKMAIIPGLELPAKPAAKPAARPAARSAFGRRNVVYVN